MSKKKHEFSIDGETYQLVKADPFAQLALDEVGSKLLGGLFRTLAKSRDAIDAVGSLLKELAPMLDDKAAFEGAMDMGLVKFVQHHVFQSEHGREAIASGLQLIAEAADMLSLRLTRDDLMAVIDNAIIGCLETNWKVPNAQIGDKLTYRQMMEDRIELHGAHHQRKLLWEAVKINMGPTIAGSLTGLLHQGAPASN